MMAQWKALAEELGVEGRVHFLGFRPQSEYAPRLRASVAVLSPSLWEAGGAVVLEAMASGKPVIATRWGGPADYLDESCGVLVDPTSREGLIVGFAEGMRRLMDAPEVGKAMGVRGREKALKDFDWEKKVDRMLEIYGMAMVGEVG
jgi:glycosyltransferase involved in cell wall biosynthesis